MPQHRKGFGGGAVGKNEARGKGLRVKHGLEELGNLDAVAPQAEKNKDQLPTKKKRNEKAPTAAKKVAAPSGPLTPSVQQGAAADDASSTTRTVFASWNEWKQVKSHLFDMNDYDKVAAALKVIHVWGSRARPAGSGSVGSSLNATETDTGLSVPAYVDATVPLVEAMWLDKQQQAAASASPPTATPITQQVLCVQYGGAISRAVHIMTGELHAGTKEADGATYRSRAKAVGLPEEAVEVRLRVAHQKLPEIEELRVVTGMVLGYLYNSFWSVQERDLKALRKEEQEAEEEAVKTKERQEKRAEQKRKQKIKGCATSDKVQELLGKLNTEEDEDAPFVEDAGVDATMPEAEQVEDGADLTLEDLEALAGI